MLPCFELTRDNFKVNFLSQGELESLSVDKFFLTAGIQNITTMRFFW